MVMMCSEARHLSRVMMQEAAASDSRSNEEQMMIKRKRTPMLAEKLRFK